MDYVIRKGKEEDVEQIRYIYNNAVMTTVATFDYNEKSNEEMQQWFYKFKESYPLVVAEYDGEIMGYCSLSPFREKEGYRHTVEISVYVHSEFQRRGIARRLIESVLQLCQQYDFKQVIAVITGGNEVSIQLHKSFGFQYVGTLQSVGKKFGKWIDADMYQYAVKE